MKKIYFYTFGFCIALSLISSNALSKTNPSLPEKSESKEKKKATLAEMLLLAPDTLIDATDKILLNNKKEPLTDPEKFELRSITSKWNQPLIIAIGIYLLILLAIATHALRAKRYYWAGFILILGLLLTSIAWFLPLIYTRRYIARGKISQQLPYMVIQMLPIGLWWYAVSDVFEWIQNLMQLRGIAPGA